MPKSRVGGLRSPDRELLCAVNEVAGTQTITRPGPVAVQGALPERPKLVRVIARLNVGGPAQHVINLTAGLKGYTTVLVAGRVDEGEAEMSSLASQSGVEVEWLPELGRRVRSWQDLVALARLYLLLRRERPLIVHTHTAKGGTLGRIAAIAAGVPVRVHTFHGHVFQGYFPPAISRIVVLIERLLARVTTKIVTISQSQAREIVEEYGICDESRVEVIPLGLNLERFGRERVAAARGFFRRELRTDDPIVTIVGRLVPIKNHGMFLRMASEMIRAGDKAAFVVVGGGPEQQALEALSIELGIADKVHFVGWRNDLERIYADSDVVALTSDNEGTPVCLIEALAAGCRIVSTNVGGVGDVLENGRLGTLVSPGDEHAFAAAVTTALSSPNENSSEGIELDTMARYGTDRLLRDMDALYGRLARAANPAAL